jgi:hypothetical protein
VIFSIHCSVVIGGNSANSFSFMLLILFIVFNVL